MIVSNSIVLGMDLVSRSGVVWNPYPDSGIPNPHVLVVGESGFGKTYLTQCLLWELSRRGISTVVIDIGQGLTRTELHSRLRSTRPAFLYAQTQGIALNPLLIRASDSNGPLNVAVRVSESFARCYRIGIKQKSILRDLTLETFADFGIRLEDRVSWRKQCPTLRDLGQKINSVRSQLDDPRSKLVESLYAHISEFFLFDVFRGSAGGLDWDSVAQAYGRILIVELGGLEGRLPQLIAEFLLWDLVACMISRGPRKLDLFCLVDEAHHLRITEGSPLEKLAREGRKFGVGLVVASQLLGDFSEAVFSNLHTKVIFQASDPTKKLARLVAAKATNLKGADEVTEIIGRLPRASALALLGNVAFQVRITSFEDRI